MNIDTIQFTAFVNDVDGKAAAFARAVEAHDYIYLTLTDREGSVQFQLPIDVLTVSKHPQTIFQSRPADAPNV